MGVKPPHPTPHPNENCCKWIEGFQHSQKALEATAVSLITHIGDREADIYEEFSQVPDAKNHVLVRLCQDRCILDSSELLFAYLASQPLAGRYQFQVEADSRRNRQARLAQIDVRFCQVQIQ